MIVQSCPNNVDIYGQAVLRKYDNTDSPVITTPNQSRVIFPINGELTGFIECTTSMKVNFSLFVESMNILLGQMLTNLESESDLLVRLEPPILSEKEFETDQYEISTNLMYELNTLAKSYDCKILFYANKHKAKEV
jgi:hypothetical protein